MPGTQAASRPVPGIMSRPSAAVMRNRRAGRRRSLAADHLRTGPCGRRYRIDRHVAARPVQMRLDDLQGERGGARRIEGIAAPFEHRHADRCRDPVSRGDDPERAFDFGPGGEGIGIDIAHKSGVSRHFPIAYV